MTEPSEAATSLRPASAVTVGVLAVICGLYALFASRADWTGTWWERAAYELGHGRNVYSQNYEIWTTGSEPEPWFVYGSGSLYVTVPLYLAAWHLTGDDTPALFVQVCIGLTALAHAGLALLGAKIALRQSGSKGAAAATLAFLAFNPILLRLGAMGDLLDLGMLFLCSLYLADLTAGRWRRSGLWLSLAVIVKQFPVLFFPDFLIRAARSRRWTAMAWSVVPALLLSLPFLVWSPKEYLFFLAGNVSAWRAVYAEAWWNLFAFFAAAGAPEQWLRLGSVALLAIALTLIYWATWRRRLSVLLAAALIANAFWFFYHSSYAIYVGWGSVFVTIALGSARTTTRET